MSSVKMLVPSAAKTIYNDLTNAIVNDSELESDFLRKLLDLTIATNNLNHNDRLGELVIFLDAYDVDDYFCTEGWRKRFLPDLQIV